MPQRPAVTGLPDDVKRALDERLVSVGFCNYKALSDWLTDQGYQISRSALQRYGQQFEEKLTALKIATEQAKAITSVVGDEEGAMNEALIRLVQQRAFEVLVKLQEDDEDGRLPKLGVMIAKLSKASVDQKKWVAEVREKASATADEVRAEIKKSGLSDEKAEEIRKKILGIV